MIQNPTVPNVMFHRAADNWKFVQEFEKAAKVYWNAKDRLPPRVSMLNVLRLFYCCGCSDAKFSYVFRL
jgi:hypothetical protein